MESIIIGITIVIAILVANTIWTCGVIKFLTSKKGMKLTMKWSTKYTKKIMKMSEKIATKEFMGD